MTTTSCCCWLLGTCAHIMLKSMFHSTIFACIHIAGHEVFSNDQHPLCTALSHNVQSPWVYDWCIKLQFFIYWQNWCNNLCLQTFWLSVCMCVASCILVTCVAVCMYSSPQSGKNSIADWLEVMDTFSFGVLLYEMCSRRLPTGVFNVSMLQQVNLKINLTWG